MVSSVRVPEILERLSHRLPSSVPRQSRFLLPLLTATTLGHGPRFLPPCLSVALNGLPRSPNPVPPEPIDPTIDEQLHPRRFAVRLVKESLVKSAVLVGVPKAIETLLELGRVVDEADRSTAFVRSDLDRGEASWRERQRSGRRGLETVYQGDIDGIFDMMRTGGLDDVRFFSESITYGTFLTPFQREPVATGRSDSPRAFRSSDPFTTHPRLLSLVTLSCLVPQNTPREILWHLRGALRRGWTRDEVEAVQTGVEMVCEELGAKVEKGMPRVADVDVQKEERQR
ncbi:hypothetical protein JCM10212_005886 [Sporobolomyces blumeae]